MLKHKNLLRLAFWLFCAPILSFCLPLSVYAQNPRFADNSIPAELIATDPEIRALINSENNSCKSESPDETVTKIEKALQIAAKRRLTGDKALIEAVLGSTLIGEGKFDMAFLAFQKALQDSIDVKNEVLEADVLHFLFLRKLR